MLRSATGYFKRKTVPLTSVPKRLFPTRDASSNQQTTSWKKQSLSTIESFLFGRCFIRAGGRLQKSGFDYCQKHPIILHGKYLVVKLFVRQIHVTNSHCPLQHTRNMLQNEFSNLSITNEIRKMLKRCRECCRQHAAAELPQMSPPEFRFPAEKPFFFQQTGLASSPLNLSQPTTNDTL